MSEDDLLKWLGVSSDGNLKEINEVTYFTCLKMLSETMGKLPLKFYQKKDNSILKATSDVAEVLLNRPNKHMTPTALWTFTEYNCQHYGNGYIWMRGYLERQKYGGEYKILDFWPMGSNYVTVLYDDVGIFRGKGDIYYQYNDPLTGEMHVFPSDQVMHFKTWYQPNGITGEPVRKILSDTVLGSLESQKFMNRLYKQGLTASMAMQYIGDLDDEKRKKLTKRYGDELSGAKNAGKIIPVPIGLQLTPLKMNLTDAQFFELKKYSALQIAGAFGIKPNQINNYEKSSYANSESQQLAFLIDTMLYRLKMYEEEINYKVLTPKQAQDGFYFKFNEKVILRTDSKTQMDTITSAVNNGLYKPNEGRYLLDMPEDEAGDKLIVNGNYIPLDMVGRQYVKEDES